MTTRGGGNFGTTWLVLVPPLTVSDLGLKGRKGGEGGMCIEGKRYNSKLNEDDQRKGLEDGRSGGIREKRCTPPSRI